MSQYDGCPDPNCDGCEGTEPYFLGKLPPAPPFSRTVEEFLMVMNSVFDQYPNCRLPMPTMVSIMIHRLNIKPHEFKEAESQSLDFLRGQISQGKLIIVKGKAGGIMRSRDATTAQQTVETKKTIEGPIRFWDKAQDTMINPLVQSSMPAINNHVCPHCKNDKVSKTESSCWKCGGAL